MVCMTGRPYKTGVNGMRASWLLFFQPNKKWIHSIPPTIHENGATPTLLGWNYEPLQPFCDGTVPSYLVPQPNATLDCNATSMSNENKKDHHREKMEVSGQRKTQAQVPELRKAQAQAERKAVALSR